MLTSNEIQNFLAKCELLGYASQDIETIFNSMVSWQDDSQAKTIAAKLYQVCKNQDDNMLEKLYNIAITRGIATNRNVRA